MKGIFKNICKTNRTIMVVGIPLKPGQSTPEVEVPKVQEGWIWTKIRAGQLKFTPTSVTRGHADVARNMNVVFNTPSFNKNTPAIPKELNMNNPKVVPAPRKEHIVKPIEITPVVEEVLAKPAEKPIVPDVLTVEQTVAKQAVKIEEPKVEVVKEIKKEEFVPEIIDLPKEPEPEVIQEEPEQPKLDREQLEAYNKTQIVAMARSMGIANIKKSKAALIDEILELNG
jgi:hypothetical protein